MIEIHRTKIYRGPNIWARVPVVHLIVAVGELEDRPTNTIPDFVERLEALLPSLDDHECSLGHPGGFLRRLREGTGMAHVLEHVTLELQNLAGAEITRGKTRGADQRGVYNVIYEYAHEEVGVAAGQFALRVLNHLVFQSEPEFNFVRELEQLIRLAERLAYGPSTAAIVATAERSGIPVLRLDPDNSLVQLGHGCHQQPIWATVTSRTSEIAK